MSKADFYTEPASNTTTFDAYRTGVTAGFAAARRRIAVSFSSGPQTIPNTGVADIYRCDTTSAGFTVNLPATPVDGEHYEFCNAGTNTLTIGRNGKTINGATSDVTITTQWDRLSLTYDSAADDWWSR